MILDKVILRGLMGSRSVGTDTETSDTDYMEVVLGGEDVYLGMDWWGNQGTKELKVTDTDDKVVETTSYELTKFLRLCQGFNPNVIPLLWLSPKHYEVLTPAGQLLVDNRRLFNSKVAVDSFCGYAYNQLKKMGLEGAATGRMGAARKDLRERYQYDVKYFYHCVRLSRMLIEFLESDGRALNVYRKHIDAEELLAIRNGKYTYNEATQVAAELLAQAHKLAETSPLPNAPDKRAIRELCKEILREHLQI